MSIVLDWQFGDGTGLSVADSSGNSHTGTIAASGSAWEAGRTGWGLRGDGTAGVVTAAHASGLAITGAYSLACLVRPLDLTSTYRSLVAKEGSSSGYYLGLNPNKVGGIYFGHNTGGNEITAPAYTVAIDQWVVLVGTFDPALGSNNLKIYAFRPGGGGGLVSQGGSATTPASNTNSVYVIGSSTTKTNCSIAAAQIYNNALSFADAQTLARTLFARGGTTGVSEDFESASVPALPSGWLTYGSEGGTAITSTTVSHGGTKSLKFTAPTDEFLFAWKELPPYPAEGEFRISAWFLRDATTAEFLNPTLWFGSPQRPPGPNPNGYPDGFGIELSWNHDSDGVSRFVYSQSNVVNTIGSTVVANPAFSSNVWYQLEVECRASPDRYYRRLVAYVRRGSDDNYLSFDGSTWVAGKVAFLTVKLAAATYPWHQGGWGIVGGFVSSDVNLYVDDFVYEGWTPELAQPETPPAPGDEVELVPSATTSVDAGQTGYLLAELNTANADDYYWSTVTRNSWVTLDAGSGKAITPTAVIVQPGTGLDEGGNDGVEYVLTGLRIQGSATSTSGPWVELGHYSERGFLDRYNPNVLRLDPDSPGGSYRYIRAFLPDDSIAISRFRVLCENSGSVDWRPAQPAFTPAAGRFAAGATVVMTTQTPGASIYYTVGTTSAPPADPDNTDTLYTAPVTIATNTPEETVIKAVAYHASGDTVYSQVTSGYYVVGKTFVPDTNVTRFGTSNTWPQDWYDSDGVLIEAHGGGVTYDSAAGKYYWLGLNFNSASLGTFADNRGVAPRGTRCYSSTDLFNWDSEGMVLDPPPPYWRWSGAKFSVVERPHVLINPSAADPNLKYVLWCHLDAEDSYAQQVAAVATAPSQTGPWTWQSFGRPLGKAILDCNVFLDPNDGKAYFLAKNITDGGYTAWELSATGDWTTFTGGSITLATTGAAEAPLLFFAEGYYYLAQSGNLTPYGGGDSDNDFIAATTLSGLASATFASLYTSAPASGSVAFNAQAGHVFRVNRLESPAYIFMCDLMASEINPKMLYGARSAWWPVSTIDTGNNSDAFPTAGDLSIDAPDAWDLSYLPDPSSSGRRRRLLLGAK